MRRLRFPASPDHTQYDALVRRLHWRRRALSNIRHRRRANCGNARRGVRASPGRADRRRHANAGARNGDTHQRPARARSASAAPARAAPPATRLAQGPGGRRLDDAEIDALLAAVTTEAGRRGRLPPSPAKEKPAVDAKPLTRQAPTDEDRAGSLTTGKLNAVRAAFKAGVKPSIRTAI
jgi:hypothetical protein